ncbi:MAG: I78 family peptidase inhibitor [Pseudomonadota bacterium]
MIRIILPLLALSTIGCASMNAQTPPAPTSCGAEKLGSLIGKQRNPETAGEAQQLSQATRIRWIAPDTMVTMDYSETRLNIHTDKAGKILSARCG